MTKRSKTVNELSTAEVVDILKQKVTAAGGLHALSRASGISTSYLGQILAGSRQPGRKILRWLGMERLTSYVRTTESAPPPTEGNSDAS